MDPTTLATHENLFRAVSNFIDEHAVVRSSALISEITSGIGGCSDCSKLFEYPIVRGTLSFEAAMVWALFVHSAPAIAVEQGDVAFPVGAFTAAGALDQIIATYDRTYDEFVLSMFYDEDDESETDSEGSEESVEDAPDTEAGAPI